MNLSNNKAKGAAQFAERSIKSRIGAPLNGRIKAVKKAQKIIQNNMYLFGLISIQNARITSSTPMIGISTFACSTVKPTVTSSGIQEGLTCRAKIPCPKNVPKTPILNISSGVILFTLF